MKQDNGAWMAPGDERWVRALRELSHDTYHTPEYVSVVAKHDGGEPACFLWQRDGRAFLLPLVLKPLRTGFGSPPNWRDGFSPYGYASPLVPENASAEELRSFFHAFKRSGAEQDLVTAFIRLHPLLPIPAELLRTVGTLVHHGATVYADLSESKDSLWKDMRKGWQHKVRGLERAGFQVGFDEWEHYRAFIEIYRESMQRVGAAEDYYFSDGYFEDLRTQLGDRIHLVSIHAPSGEVAAAALNLGTGEFLQGHLSGTLGPYMRLSPSVTLYHAGALWAKEQGFRFFHVGGGVGGSNSDSLFQFKSGFSRHRADTYTLRMVLNPHRYQWLLERSGREGHDPSGWFPPYRAAS